MALLEFIFSSFWTFLGSLILAMIGLNALAIIGRTLVAMVALAFGRNANVK